MTSSDTQNTQTENTQTKIPINTYIGIKSIPRDQLKIMVRCKSSTEFKQQYPEEYFTRIFNFIEKASDHVYTIQSKHEIISWPKNEINKSCMSISSRLLQCYELLQIMKKTDFKYYDIGDDILRLSIQEWFFFMEQNYARMSKYYE